MSAIAISSAAVLALIVVAMLVAGPACAVCVSTGLVGVVVFRRRARRRRALPERWDWDRFETEFREHVQRLERAS